MTTHEPDDLIRAVVVDDLETINVGPGVVRRSLPSTDFATGWVIDFAPGSQWPEIDHHSTEERYYVESGEIIEGTERYSAGTYVVLAPGSEHRPRSERGARIIGINQA
jgi:quercetin dioxygenase-like cupin family protein